MKTILRLIADNKEWLFSGIATSVLVGIWAWIVRIRRAHTAEHLPETPRAARRFQFSVIANSALKASRMTEKDLLAALDADFERHPLLASIASYESLPIPLREGFVVIVTKRDSDYFVEDVRTRMEAPALFEAWVALRNAYFAAYRLPYRRDHHVLRNERAFRETYAVINTLYDRYTDLYAACLFVVDVAFLSYLHDQKQVLVAHRFRVEAAHRQQERGEDAANALGDLTISLEMVISAVHKVLTQASLLPTIAQNTKDKLVRIKEGKLCHGRY